MKETDLMHGGSVGKTLFAALALQLVAEARSRSTTRSRNTSPRSLVPGLPNASTITVRMLLNHTTDWVNTAFVYAALVESPAKSTARSKP